MSDDNNVIIGYYNLGTGYIEQNDHGVIRKIGGAIHINCFALDERYHGLLQKYTDDGVKVNLSDVLLNDCLERIEAIRRQYIGFTFITLSSTREGYSLYARNGFEKLDGDMNFAIEDSDVECVPMYLWLEAEEDLR